jgi:exopolyphosphatase/guanosine-5'-triphosphate,3'-diphosphate pyrophosphatase
VRVAAIDLGSNSTRLLVADVDDGRIEEVVRRLAITRLGEGVDLTGRLGDEPIARVRRVVADYRLEVDRLDAARVLAIATSAVRDAANGPAFLADLATSFDLTTRILDGDEEAVLTFRGVTSDRRLESRTLLVDIGGGSTELVVGDSAGVASAVSLQLGSVRLTERYLNFDPPRGDELEACASHVRALLPPLDVPGAIGVAGTITTLAAIDLGLAEYDPTRTHGHRLTRSAVERGLAHLASLALAERRGVTGLDPARAPVIVAGAVILREIMTAYSLEEIEVGERDILHGAALAAAELTTEDTRASPAELRSQP